ncbi:DUF3789 domain-containing protein [Ruminococcus bromii]|uniref:DUF3789 domain-containing protein n=1 Tax=Ruminococcus bromii TaxID=40518 RepID=UPI00345B5BA1
MFRLVILSHKQKIIIVKIWSGGKILLVGFIIGLFVGGIIGVSVMCLLYYTRD